MSSGNLKRTAIWMLSFSLLLSAAARELRLKIIQTTDLHGHVEHGRLARTATLVERETRAAGGVEQSLRIDCGDLIQGSYAMTFPAGRAFMIQYLNQLSFDVFIPGNHDFEFGSAVLLPLLRQFHGTVAALNLDWKNAPIQPWKMFRRNQLNIAVIGIAFPSPDRMFIPPVLGAARPLKAESQLEKIIPQVMRLRPDLIILAVHAGEQTRFGPRFTLFDLIRKYPQIDLVLCGHSHQPEAGKAIGDHSWRMQGPALAGGIGVADVVFDPEKKRIISLKTRLIPIDDVPEHPEVKRQVNELSRRIARQGNEEIAEIPFELRPPEKNESASALTELCGKAIMAGTGAEIVFYGIGSRFRRGPGLLNQFQLFRFLPYADHAVTVELTADEIRRILAEQLTIRRKNGMYQPPCGLRFTRSRRQLRSITLDSTGAALEPERMYRTAFSSYIFSGSGRCPVLHAIVKTKKAEYSRRTVREMTAEYARKTYPIRKKTQEMP